MFFDNKNEKGFGVMEVVVATGIFALIVTSLVAGLINFDKWQRVYGEKARAVTMTKECLEVVRNLRDADFASLNDGTFGLVKGASDWSLVSSAQSEDGYTRTVNISAVNANLKEVVCETGWTDNMGRQDTFLLTSLLSDWQREVLPNYSTCPEYCVSLGYNSGTCRQNNNQCSQNGETNEPDGDVFCTETPSNDTCCCSGASSVDTTPPDAVNDLVGIGVGNDYIDLSWTATGDDGSLGVASGYDLRYGTNFIDDASWSGAQEVVGEPTPVVSGSTQNMTVNGLNPLTTYYFAIKVFDEAGNYSELSNVVTEITTGQIITSCDEYCQSIFYTGGVCRASRRECTQNGETREGGGNQYCPGDKQQDNCCCS